MMATNDFFRGRLDQMIDLHHPLVVLAGRMRWGQIASVLAPAFARKNRSGQVMPGNDLFGTTLEVGGAGVSTAGRPLLPIRLMAALLYCKHAFNVSNEERVARWSENVIWKYFSGQDYYTPTLPCEATQIGRFRTAIGEAGVEALLKVSIDTTEQKKAIVHPVDSRLLEIARAKVVQAAKDVGICLKQTFVQEGKELCRTVKR